MDDAHSSLESPHRQQHHAADGRPSLMLAASYRVRRDGPVTLVASRLVAAILLHMPRHWGSSSCCSIADEKKSVMPPVFYNSRALTPARDTPCGGS